MSDEALTGTDSQLKNIAKTAADSLSKLVDRNAPLPSKYEYTDVGITINDSAGNKIYQSPTSPF